MDTALVSLVGFTGLLANYHLVVLIADLKDDLIAEQAASDW
jgi:hypothetical protein